MDVKLVVNCEAQLIVGLLAEAAEWEAKGDMVNAETAKAAAANALVASGVVDPIGEAERVVPLSGDEIAQRVAETSAADALASVEAARDLAAGTLRARLDDAIGRLEAAHADWETLSVSEKDAAVRLNIRTSAALARLTRHKLDAPAPAK